MIKTSVLICLSTNNDKNVCLRHYWVFQMAGVETRINW